MRAVDSSAAPTQPSDSDEVTVERLEHAIGIVVEMMEKHNRPRLIEHVRRLKAEIDRLQNASDPMVEARQILSEVHNIVHNVPTIKAVYY